MRPLSTLALAALSALVAAAAPPPGARLQNHGQNVVVRHDPAGASIDIVAEDPGSCPGPGPTTIMRLRSADREHAIIAVVARSVNVGGTITTATQSYTVAPMAAVDLGCMAQPAPGGGTPRSTTEWKIVSSRTR